MGVEAMGVEPEAMGVDLFSSKKIATNLFPG
jgi:hypothetical protein